MEREAFSSNFPLPCFKGFPLPFLYRKERLFKLCFLSFVAYMILFSFSWMARRKIAVVELRDQASLFIFHLVLFLETYVRVTDARSFYYVEVFTFVLTLLQNFIPKGSFLVF